MKETLRFDKINEIPATTWSWLKMNRASLEVVADAEAAGGSREITATRRGESVRIPLEFEDGRRHEHEQTVTAEADSEVTVIIDYTSGADAGGLSSVRTRLVAKPRARIHLVKVNLLGSGFVQLDETECECAEDAEIEVTQIELGGAKTYAQVRCGLAGDRSRYVGETAYICAGTQVLDMNHVVSHVGRRTDTKMTVRGTVGGSALKTYRGTIDFRRGCAGATGDEQEETLLLSPTAVNKSIPLILCDEEDVSGTHGATIGRLGADELFYFGSRGIPEPEAEKILSRAKVASAAGRIPDEELRRRIAAFIGADED